MGQIKNIKLHIVTDIKHPLTMTTTSEVGERMSTLQSEQRECSEKIEDLMQGLKRNHDIIRDMEERADLLLKDNQLLLADTDVLFQELRGRRQQTRFTITSK